MKALYSNHQTGRQLQGGNIFMVEPPPLTEQEVEELNRRMMSNKKYDEDQEELFGGWV